MRRKYGWRCKLDDSSMKKIVFDLTKVQPVYGSKFHGGGKYGEILFEKLVNNHPDVMIAYYDKDLYINDKVLNLIDANGLTVYHRSDMSILDVAQKEQAMIYSPLMDTKYLECPDHIPVVVTIHGLRDLEMPSDDFEKYYAHKRKFLGNLALLLGLSGLRKKYINKMRRESMLTTYNRLFNSSNISFITVSEHSKYSILSFFPSVESDRIKVFYSPSTVSHDVVDSHYKEKYGKYWLMVSGDRWQKNCVRAIIAFDQLFSERRELQGKVVITGLKSFDQLKIRIQNKERFICLGYVEDIELKALYRDAFAFVYPSLNEGFGYPPMEAMHAGTPVIASAITSIPEVCGDAVLYFNPFMIDEIKVRILEMEDSNTRSYYISKGIARQKEIEKKQNEDLMNVCEYLKAL